MRNVKSPEASAVNTSRQYELDLLKALAIMSMIICHAVYQLGVHVPGYENDVRYLAGDVFFGEYLAVAHAFMFAMGVGVVYSKRNRPSDLIRRGIRLYVLGFILNFFRYGVYALIDGLIEGQFVEETVYALVVQDILHFAGLALIATGLFKRLRLSAVHVFVIGVIFSALGGALAFVYQGSPAANYLIGHFVTTTEQDSCFAFFNWYFFVAAGLLFGTILRRTEDTDGLYRKMFRISGPVMILYIILAAVFEPKFMTKNGWYYAVSLPESVGLLSIDLTLLCAFRLLLKKVSADRLSVFITMSRNVTPIYCIHWCILGFVDSIFCYLLGVVFPYWAMYLFGVILIPVSCMIADRWAKRKRPPADMSMRAGK